MQPIITKIYPDPRPCLINGRRALFHRWADSARPVAPRGLEDDETSQRYQLHSVHGIVEYEDGTVARVWPSDIRFIDGGHFPEWAWEQMENHAAMQDEEARRYEEK